MLAYEDVNAAVWDLFTSLLLFLLCLNDRKITFACPSGLNRLPCVHKNTIFSEQL